MTDLFNFTGGIRRWGWKGNNSYDNCTVAATDDEIQAKGTAADSVFRHILYQLGFTPPSNRVAIQEYIAYLATQGETPQQNIGADPGHFLNWMMEQGHILNWTPIPIDASNRAQSAIQAAEKYRGCIMTLALTANMYNHFYAKHPWEIGTGPGNTPLGRLEHEVALVRATPKYLVVATWNRNKLMTYDCADQTIMALYAFLTEQDKIDPNFDTMMTQMTAERVASKWHP